MIVQKTHYHKSLVFLIEKFTSTLHFARLNDSSSLCALFLLCVLSGKNYLAWDKQIGRRGEDKGNMRQ
jgi:hypothetical protein